jgi:hypothetical protein
MKKTLIVAGVRFARTSQGYEPRELLLLYPAVSYNTSFLEKKQPPRHQNATPPYPRRGLENPSLDKEGC